MVVVKVYSSTATTDFTYFWLWSSRHFFSRLHPLIVNSFEVFLFVFRMFGEPLFLIFAVLIAQIILEVEPDLIERSLVRRLTCLGLEEPAGFHHHQAEHQVRVQERVGPVVGSTFACTSADW